MADRAIAALECSALPLYRWDVQREVRRHQGVHLRASSLGSSLASDWRTCWAGPGLYGLYRHGLLPGVRDIGATAGVLIHVSDRSLTLDEVRFVMRFLGYRVTASSIYQALWRVADDDLFKATWNGYIGRSGSELQQRAAARAMGLGRRGPVFRAITERAAAQVAAALRERERRLERGGPSA